MSRIARATLIMDIGIFSGIGIDVHFLVPLFGRLCILRIDGIPNWKSARLFAPMTCFHIATCPIVAFIRCQKVNSTCSKQVANFIVQGAQFLQGESLQLPGVSAAIHTVQCRASVLAVHAPLTATHRRIAKPSSACDSEPLYSKPKRSKSFEMVVVAVFVEF